MRKPKKVDAPQWIELSNLTYTVLDCAQWELKALNLMYTFADFKPGSPLMVSSPLSILGLFPILTLKISGIVIPNPKTLQSLGLGLDLSLSKKITWSLWIKISYR